MRAAPSKCAKSPGSTVAKNCSCASISASCKWKSPDDPMAGVRTVANRSWNTIRGAQLAFLDEWLEEVKAKRPLSKLEIMQREMETAIAKELYERAAELRDAIKRLKTQKQA